MITNLSILEYVLDLLINLLYPHCPCRHYYHRGSRPSSAQGLLAAAKRSRDEDVVDGVGRISRVNADQNPKLRSKLLRMCNVYVNEHGKREPTPTK